MYFTLHLIPPPDRNGATPAPSNSQISGGAQRSLTVPYRADQSLDELWRVAQERAGKAFGSEELAGLYGRELQDSLGSHMIMTDRIGDLFEPAASQQDRQLYMKLDYLDRSTPAPSRDLFSSQLARRAGVDGEDEVMGRSGGPRSDVSEPTSIAREERASSMFLPSSSQPSPARPNKRLRGEFRSAPPKSSPLRAFEFLDGSQPPPPKLLDKWTEAEDEELRKGKSNSRALLSRAIEHVDRDLIHDRWKLRSSGIARGLSAPAIKRQLLPKRSDSAIRARKKHLKSTGSLRTRVNGAERRATSLFQSQPSPATVPPSSAVPAATLPDTRSRGPKSPTQPLGGAKTIGDETSPAPIMSPGPITSPEVQSVSLAPRRRSPLVVVPRENLRRQNGDNYRTQQNSTQVVPTANDDEEKGSECADDIIHETDPAVGRDYDTDVHRSRHAHQDFFRRVSQKERNLWSMREAGGDEERAQIKREDARVNEDLLNAVLRNDRVEVDALKAKRRQRKRQRICEDAPHPSTSYDDAETREDAATNEVLTREADAGEVAVIGEIAVNAETESEEVDEEFGREQTPAWDNTGGLGDIELPSDGTPPISDDESMIRDREVVEVEEEENVAVDGHPHPHPHPHRLLRAAPVPSDEAVESEEWIPTSAQRPRSRSGSIAAAAVTESAPSRAGKRREARKRRRSRASTRRKSVHASSRGSVSDLFRPPDTRKSAATEDAHAAAVDDRVTLVDGATVTGSWARLVQRASFPEAPRSSRAAQTAKTSSRGNNHFGTRGDGSDESEDSMHER